MKKFFLILLLPLMFIFCGASFENFPFSIGPCLFFPVDNNKVEKENVKEIRESAEKTKKDNEGNIHKELKVEEGKLLDVNLDSGGSIKISGWDKNIVSVDVISSENNLDYLDFNFNATSSGVEASSENKEYSTTNGLTFIFKVPARFDLQIKSMGGPVSIKNVNGKINGETMGGGLDLSNLKGNLDLNTMGGPIKLYDSEVEGKVHTMGGPVEITNVKGNVKGTTNGGPVIMKNVTSQNGNNSDVITVSSMGGEINVDDAPAGANLKTMGGAIIVRSAKKFVKAKTYSGNIDIENIDGAIDASTMGGNIEAEMVGNPDEGDRGVTLSSKAGDVTLIVPEGLSMNIEITLAYTENNNKEYKIYSDFPLNKETSPEWDSRHGTSRKYIYGNGKTGDGKNKIAIETINGNVYLKKG
jgi:hypothetical protein